MNNEINKIMQASPVIPVMTINRLEDAVPLAKALVNGGLRVLEITLRTPVALAAIKEIKAAVPEAIVGSGTVLNAEMLEASVNAGVNFIVSPGITPSLLEAALEISVPILPGVNSPSEVMNLLDHGITAMKFFPAEAAGGLGMLKSIAAPLPQAMFCPTGGVTFQNAADYLALENVACVGGSWMVTEELVLKSQWGAIQKQAALAASLNQHLSP